MEAYVSRTTRQRPIGPQLCFMNQVASVVLLSREWWNGILRAILRDVRKCISTLFQRTVVLLGVFAGSMILFWGPLQSLRCPLSL